MKIKDSFVSGAIMSVVAFFIVYSIINIFTSFPFLSQSRDSLWTYVVSIIPNLLLSRFMLVNWDKESTGKGLIFMTLIGIILMFIVLK